MAEATCKEDDQPLQLGDLLFLRSNPPSDSIRGFAAIWEATDTATMYQSSGLSATAGGRLAAVDVLRGVAALMVLLYHARLLLWCGPRELWQRYGATLNLETVLGYSTVPLKFGFLGVPLFFVLSGYCIHRQNARSLATRTDFRLDVRRYIVRRLWRIYPVYITALVITYLADKYLVTRDASGLFAGVDNTAYAFVSSVMTLQGMAAPQFGSNGVFWTLAIELHLYAAYLLLFAMGRRSAWIPLAVAFAASVAYIVANRAIHIDGWFPHRSPNGGPIFLPYWFAWTMGMFLADSEAGRVALPRATGLVAIPAGLVSCVLQLCGLADVAWLGWPFAFGGLLCFALEDRRSTTWLRMPTSAVQRVGVFSYSLYATHVPVLLVAAHWLTDDHTKTTSLLPAALGCGAALLFSLAVFQVVEQWSLRLPTKRGANST